MSSCREAIILARLVMSTVVGSVIFSYNHSFLQFEFMPSPIGATWLCRVDVQKVVGNGHARRYSCSPVILFTFVYIKMCYNVGPLYFFHAAASSYCMHIRQSQDTFLQSTGSRIARIFNWFISVD